MVLGSCTRASKEAADVSEAVSSIRELGARVIQGSVRSRKVVEGVIFDQGRKMTCSADGCNTAVSAR